MNRAMPVMNNSNPPIKGRMYNSYYKEIFSNMKINDWFLIDGTKTENFRSSFHKYVDGNCSIRQSTTEDKYVFMRTA